MLAKVTFMNTPYTNTTWANLNLPVPVRQTRYPFIAARVSLFMIQIPLQFHNVSIPEIFLNFTVKDIWFKYMQFSGFHLVELYALLFITSVIGIPLCFSPEYHLSTFSYNYIENNSILCRVFNLTLMDCK